MEDLVRRTVGPETAVEIHGTDHLWSTLVDPNQLENVLLNLCINARDAMPDGGTISIETGNRTIDRAAGSLREIPAGDYVSLAVSDNGVGMTHEVAKRAFEPFYTTKPIGLGTGLGLSMIHGFVNQSGGHVRIHSAVGQGTTVTVFLPRHAIAEAAPANVEVENADPAAKGSATVLVIDDEALVRMLVVEVLEDLGYRTLEAGDGPDGLKVLRSEAKIDLLITDVGLPNGMNGRQVADAAREIRPDLKVMFVTGYAETAVLSNGNLDPGMQIVTKPFEMNAFAKRVQEFIKS
jgi:CheY-like chemotaxis protein